MTNYPSDLKLYKFHVANLRSIRVAIDKIAISTRSAIAEENKQTTESFVRLYAFLLGAWAETRLKKILFEPYGFQESERQLVLSQSTQLESWQKAVEIAFRKQYNVPSATLTANTLLFTPFKRYSEISEIIDKDLRPVIEIRNKLAHGQWVYPLNNEGSAVEENKYTQLNNENLPSLQYKRSLLSSISDIIHDLIVSIATFERDFDTHYKQITTTRENLKNRKYADYVNREVAKRRRGMERRKQNRITNQCTKQQEAQRFSLIHFIKKMLGKCSSQ
jgi:hypothetical protein